MTKLKKFWIFFNKPYVSLPFMLINVVGWIIFTEWNLRCFYSKNYNCSKIIQVIEKSSYKGRPSIVIQDYDSKFEFYQDLSYDYDFRNLKINDKICKQSHSLSFIRIREGYLNDTINYKGDKTFSRLFGYNVKDFNSENKNCDCK